MTEKELEEAFIRDVKLHAKMEVALLVDLPYAVQLVGQLQLALRHPGNIGESATLTREFVKALIDIYAVTPAIRAALERGWTAKYDMAGRSFSQN